VKKFIIILFVLLSNLSFSQEYNYTCTLFTNSAMPGGYFFSRTESAGNSSVLNINNRLPVCDSLFHTPGNTLEISYVNADGGNWLATINQKNLRGMDHFKKGDILSFWLYSPMEIIASNELPGLLFHNYDNNLSAMIKLPQVKPGQWQHIIIHDLTQYNVDPAHPENITGIVFSQNPASKPGKQVLFIDDIEFLPDNQALPAPQIPKILVAKGYAMHVDISWQPITDPDVRFIKIYRSENDGDYKPVGVQEPYLNRYEDFTGETGKKYSYKITAVNQDYEESGFSLGVSASTIPMTDDQLLTMVQEACFRYYWDGAEPVSGMAREDIPGRTDMVATGASGFGIMALIVGTERQFITRDQSVDRFLKILAFLEKAERFHGVYGHFMDGPTGKEVPFFGPGDNGADLVETSFLLQGLLAARQYFIGENEKEKLIREKITKIWEEAEFDWFRRDPDSKFLYWHWSPDQGWVMNHRLIGWNETMIAYILAISSPTHGVPAEMYYSGWASQDRFAQKYRMNWGGSEDGKMYSNGNSYFGIKLDIGVNNGGPLFFTHYSYMGFDPHFLTDKYTNYFVNNQAIAKINYNYCVDNPNHYKDFGENCWGLTASDGPFDYSADEPIPSRDPGKIAPTGAIASFPYTPEESMKALKNYYYNYGKFLWGEYGFKDAFDLTENWCSDIYMGLNQAPMVVMIENYRTGLIWNLFMKNEEIQKGIEKIEKAKQ
jgi:exo beta-1,2-glucooligosaccharide sophorohydrolase (non-reducing end)